MGALDRVRSAVSAVAADAVCGVRDTASAAGDVVRDQLASVRAGADPADVSDPRGPRPWPFLIAEPFCLVRLCVPPGDALAALAESLAGAGLCGLRHRDGWGCTTAQTERAARAGDWYLELSIPLPHGGSVEPFHWSRERVIVRGSGDESTGGRIASARREARRRRARAAGGRRSGGVRRRVESARSAGRRRAVAGEVAREDVTARRSSWPAGRGAGVAQETAPV